MIPPKYKYYIQVNNENRIEVNPHYKELSKKYAKESNQEFFRISLDGKMTLYGSDYEVVKNSSLEDNLVFTIDKYNESTKTWIEYYKGEFNKTDCKFDYDKKSCEIKTNTLDSYTSIMNKYEDTYDLIKLAPAITSINLYKRSLMQCYIRGGSTISNFFSGTYYETDVNEAIDDNNTLKNTYYFSYIQASNEFEIRNASIAEVNGLYAGQNGIYTNQETGCVAFLEKYNENIPPLRPYLLGVRKADGTVLYKSTDYINILDDSIDTIDFDENTDKHIRYGVTLYNINDSNDSCNISNLFVYYLYRRLLCDVDSITDSEGVKNTYNIPADDFATTDTNYKKCIGLRGGTFFCSSLTAEEPTKFGKNDYGGYFTDNFLPATVGITKVWPICRSSWINTSLWYAYEPSYFIFEAKLRKEYTLKDSYSIGAAIKALLKKIDPTITHEETAEYSQFLYADNSPIALSRFYVFITQKTNILKGEYDQAAQKAEISFKDIMDMLRDCFRCYWYIEDNKLKIEHILFFNNGGSYTSNTNTQLDFTTLTDQFNKKLIGYFQKSIEYNKDNLNARYEFSWADDSTDVFGPLYIDVKSNYIQKDKTEDISVSKFSSDVDFMLFNPSNFSEDGFALLCPIKDNGIYKLPIIDTDIKDENDNMYEVQVQNWYASWLYLIRCYMYDMPATNIEANSISILSVFDIKRCMSHTIEFPVEEDLDELELIKTSIGNGKIDEFSVNMNTRLAKVNLTYKPQ